MTVYYVRICTTGDQIIPLILTVVDKAVLLLLGLFWTIEIRQVRSFILFSPFALLMTIHYEIVKESSQLDIDLLFNLFAMLSLPLHSQVNVSRRVH